MITHLFFIRSGSRFYCVCVRKGLVIQERLLNTTTAYGHIRLLIIDTSHNLM